MSNGAAAVESLMRQYGCLPQIGQGSTLNEFNPLGLAQALEQELNKCAELGLAKITLHMDLKDAASLARVLRKG